MQLAHDRSAARRSGRSLQWYLVVMAFGLLSAQDVIADQPSSSAETSAGALAEVTVYARRREEKIEDTPVAITVQTGQELQNASAVLIADVGREVPNTRMVSSPQSVSALDVTIRGQTVNRSAIMFDPAVGLYVDGLYIANGQGSMMTLLDMDSVEVIRGSQGTLFGRNNTGGSILMLTHRPDLQQTSAEVALGAGNYDQFMDRAIFNLPIGNDLAIRVAYQGNYRSGFGSSIGSGQENFENQHRYEARFGALWKPAPGTEVYLTYERFDATEIGGLLHPLTGPPPGTLVSQVGGIMNSLMIPGFPVVQFPTNPYQTDAGFPSYDDAYTDTVQLTMTQKLAGDVSAKLILAYRHLYANTAIDVDATTLPLADTTLYNTSNQKSAELQFNGKSLGQRLDWVAGLYWFQDNGGAPSVQSAAPPGFFTAFTSPQFIAANQAANGALSFIPTLFTPFPVYDQNWVSNRSEAAYAHGEYQLTPQWAVAAGVRYTDDRRQAADDAYFVNPGVPGIPLGQNCTLLDPAQNPLPPFLLGGPCPANNQSVTYDYWSWEASSRYRLTPELMAYVRAGHSQRSGGWNVPFTTVNQDQPFRPETLTDYEIGMKADLLGGALVLNGDVFYGIYDDMQRLLARLNPDGTPVTIITNAGKARVSGAELEAQWRATARTTLGTSFGWTDARYDTFLYQPTYVPVPGLPPQNLANNEFYQTPRLSGDVYGSYQFPVSVGEVMLRADYAWQDRVEFNVINDFNYQGPYGTANARVALTSHARDWELALFADNITDKHYAYTGGTLGAPLAPSPTIAWNVPGARRTAGIEGTYRWNTSH